MTLTSAITLPSDTTTVTRLGCTPAADATPDVSLEEKSPDWTGVSDIDIPSNTAVHWMDAAPGFIETTLGDRLTGVLVGLGTGNFVDGDNVVSLCVGLLVD
mmetsp:Transcript_16970/g.32201  ORF Transcript_16970/g.32201 Transcript_16970/m.32201 type:complete len:101 (+) Transcript_16970:199-501(+)